LEKNPQFSAFVTNKSFQSKTVIVANCGEYTEKLAAKISGNGMHPGAGYGPFKKTQLRFANFPTHSKEQFELLVDTIG
jgi:phosphoserine aminotransferase